MAQKELEGYYRQAKLWDLERYEGNEDQCRRARVIASLIDPEVESILDVGCGNGFITRHLQASRVVGLDPSEEALAHFDGESVIGVADSLPFQDRSFDAVVCTEVLEHLSDETFSKALRELDRVAKRFLVIGVPYRQDLREGMTQCRNCHAPYHVDLHRRSFRAAVSIERLFPGFLTKTTALMGKQERIRSRLFTALRYSLVGPWGQSPWGICPNCGAKGPPDLRKSKRLRRRFFDGLAWRMKKETMPRWVIVLLKRNKHAG